MAPRRTVTIEPDHDTDEPFREVIRQDNENVAEMFAGIVEEFGGAQDGSIRGHLYRVQRSGKFEWIGEYWPPFDQAEIFREMREKYNGGDYQLRVMVAGRRGIQKTIPFAVAPGPTAPLIPAAKDDSSGLIAMMLQQSSASADRQMQMLMEMSRQSQAQMAAAQASQNQLMGILIPAMLGGREKTSEIIGMVAALRPPESGPKMGELIGTLKDLKELTGSEGSKGDGFDPEGPLVDNIMRMAGPVAGALGRAFQARGEAPVRTPVSYADNPAPIVVPPAALALAAPVPEPPVLPQPSKFPLIELVRDDLLFHFGKGRDPEWTAETIADLIEQAGVTREAIDETVAAFAVSPDWIDDLAGEGVDLRGNREWAQRFLTELGAIFAEADEDGAEPARGTGSAADTDGDGEHGEGGEPSARTA